MKYQKVAIIALGKRNAGKSNTWYEIFGRVIRSGYKQLQLNSKELVPFVKNSSFEESGDEIENYFDVFVRNASFEEAGDEPEDCFDEDNLPKIVFCSVQYIEHGIETLNWFKEHDYYLYIQWINPGYRDSEKYPDRLGFEARFKDFGEFKRVSGKEKAERASEIKTFLKNFVGV